MKRREEERWGKERCRSGERVCGREKKESRMRRGKVCNTTAWLTSVMVST